MPQKYQTDTRMLDLIEILKELGEIRSTMQFGGIIGMSRQNIGHVKAGNASFSGEHISKACREFMVNANWIINTEQNLFRGRKNSPALDKIIERHITKNTTPVSI